MDLQINKLGIFSNPYEKPWAFGACEFLYYLLNKSVQILPQFTINASLIKHLMIFLLSASVALNYR